MNFIMVGLGGFIGAILRYGLSGLMHRVLGSNFPYGTLAVNVLGSFALGLFLTLSSTRLAICDEWKSFIAVGILGAFTTFSTFSFETIALLQERLLMQAFLNIGLNVILALASVWAGMALARII